MLQFSRLGNLLTAGICQTANKIALFAATTQDSAFWYCVKNCATNF